VLLALALNEDLVLCQTNADIICRFFITSFVIKHHELSAQVRYGDKYKCAI